MLISCLTSALICLQLKQKEIKQTSRLCQNVRSLNELHGGNYLDWNLRYIAAKFQHIKPQFNAVGNYQR